MVRSQSVASPTMAPKRVTTTPSDGRLRTVNADDTRGVPTMAALRLAAWRSRQMFDPLNYLNGSVTFEKQE